MDSQKYVLADKEPRKARFNALIGERDSGKTEFLLKKAVQSIRLQTSLLIVDSATEHREKSLLIKLSEKYDGTILSSPPKSEIMGYFEDGAEKAYPYHIIREAFDKCGTPLILADVSYYLEEGHRAAPVDRAGIRRLYQMLALQVLQVFAAITAPSMKADVIMDEIEMTQDYGKALRKLTNRDLTLWASAHLVSAFNPVRDLFTLYTIRNYRIQSNEDFM